LYLSKLELFGFKSFPFKTEFVFDDGITTIVGPNGCGKTNILDAIRWVLGEQRTSLLRGERMEHVIFNGTKELKPLGMAEVSLTIQNNRGILPTEYEEVNISRRLYRSGESEYLLNKRICRLKDIIDLFLDTGMGTHAYSVIQPEMVESILSNKAEDRRFLFEEASGISKYKHRKKESLRKLESTENDLLRLKDLTSEVEKQVNSLRRQVSKAERFRRLSGELKDLELKLGKSQYDLLQEKEEDLKSRLSNLDEERVTRKAKMSETELEYEKLKLDLTQAEKNYFSLKKDLDFYLEHLHNLEKETALLNERKLNLEKQKDRLLQEIEDGISRKATISLEIEDKERKIEDVLKDIETREKKHQQQEEELKVLDERLKGLKEKSSSLNTRLQDAERILQKKELEKQNLKTQMEELCRERNSLFEEKEKLTTELKKAISDNEAHKSSALSCKNSLEDKIKEKASLQEKSEEIEKRLINLNNEKVDREKEKSSLNAQFELFRNMVEHYEGYQAGVKALLERKDTLPGLIAPVAELISTEEEYLKPIEIALGEAAQFILSRDLSSTQTGIKILKEEKKGRATFIVLEGFKGQSNSSELAELTGAGIRGWARDFVKCRNEYTPVINFLLGKIVIADSFQNGLELSEELGEGYGVVTLDGQMIRGGKLIEGGSEKEVFLIGREEELNKLSEKLSSLEKEVNKLSEQIETEHKKKSEISSCFMDLDKSIEEERARLKSTELNLARNEEFRRGLIQQSEVLEREDEELKGRGFLLAEKEKDLSAEEQKEKRDLLYQEHKKAEENLEEEEAERENIYSNLNELRIELVTLQGKEEQSRNDLERLKELLSELEADEELRKKELETILSEAEKLNAKNSEAKNEFEKKEKEKEEKEDIVENSRQEFGDIQQKLICLEDDLKAQRMKKEELQDSWHKLEMEKLEVLTNRENLRKKLIEEQEKDLEEVAELSQEEEEQVGIYPQRISELKERLKQIGAVNLLAAGEYQQQKERLDFLQKQMQDLIEAKENLVSTIEKINKTATELFLETFQQVKINFQKVFEQLFEGGEAEVNLLEGADPLESPIEISARPMGKKLINISQLSGGEKALTALSLLFALYLVKPSPFCVLDEVDAPLDDANLTRFLNLIKTFSQRTQFVIITHNKMTMEAADALYGVTMEKRGVSKIVSVKLKPSEIIADKA